MSLPAAAVLVLACLLASTAHLYVGVGFWRLHRDSFTRLSVYVLTHQPGLIANFSASRPRALRRANALALDALSFPRLLKVFLGWPWYAFAYREVLDLARYSSRVIGDERSDELASRLRALGFPQADADDVKSSDRFVDGFLVRRLDDDLVAIFWHETGSIEGGECGAARRVVPFRVPAERRIRLIAQAFQRWGNYAQLVEGQARSRSGRPMPYVVVYEPFSFGKPWSLRAVAGLFRDDARSLFARLGGHPPHPAPEDEFPFSDEDSPSFDAEAELAYHRFLLSVRRPGPEGPQGRA